MIVHPVPEVVAADDAGPGEPPAEALYALLPAIYRDRDHDLGQPLRALLGVMQGAVLDPVLQSVDALYDDWFIETCSSWVVPYIGDLVGAGSDAADPEAIPTVRARVANALGYTRRKGTAWILARAARDASGWAARGMEYWRYVASTQPLADVSLRRGGTVRVSSPRRAAGAADPVFDSLAHTGTVRTAEQGGRYALTRLGLFLWRLFSFPLEGAEPRQTAPGSGRYALNPFGARTRLFVPPGTEPRPGREPGPWQVPQPFTAGLLRRALEPPRGGAHDPWTAGGYPPLEVWAGPTPAELRRCRIVVAPLDHWRWPPNEPAEPGPVAVAVDPELGRLRFREGEAPGAVRASWSYGFSAGIGGGPYARAADFAPPARGAWQVRVGGARPDPLDDAWFPTLGDAVRRWAGADPVPGDGVITVMDSARHASPEVPMPPGVRLLVAAAAGEAPWLEGDLAVEAGRGSSLTLRGLWIDGTVTLSGRGAELKVEDCTVSPPVSAAAPRPAVEAARGAAESVVTVSRSIVGPLRLHESLSRLVLGDSIVAAAPGGESVGGGGEGGYGPPAAVERSTVLGTVAVAELGAADAVFVQRVRVARPAEGGASHCYLLPGAGTPARFACVPTEGGGQHPSFTSTRYGAPGFAQLSSATPRDILAGASDGSEMGAFHSLQQPRREANLRAAVDEFLPAWMQAVVTFVT
jgi:hypothetical protein